MDFVSPVLFRRQQDNHIVVINTFAMGNASDLAGRSIDTLTLFDILEVPVQTVVWGKSLGALNVFEATLTLNGQVAWYYQYKMGSVTLPEGQTPQIRLPLDELKRKIKTLQ
ncbi:MAG: hypothetical protein HY645_09760 [Acidobacteria bacterium]|nr:hypothetical protein [Acidobacteriota bacterium]